jgi:hypothetical protein
VVPQKFVGEPDQSSKSNAQDVKWPYVEDLDHNAGSCSRSATIIKVEPLPEGSTDIDILEAGWNYVDQEKIIIYGAIDGTDSNGNGILDSEEKKGGETADFDGDGTPDYLDSDTANIRNSKGNQRIRIHAEKGSLVQVRCLKDDDPSVSGTSKPTLNFPYGVNSFQITGLSSGETVTVKLEFAENVPTNAKYYKIDSNGNWSEIPYGSNDGDKEITISLTDGDPMTDADGLQNGIIDDPGALGYDTESAIYSTDDSSSGSDDSTCFISSLYNR